MASLLDFHADRNGVELARMAREYDFPAFVKAASLASLRDPSAVPPTAYADPLRRRFACHTKAATWLAALYFHDGGAAADSKTGAATAQRLEKMAEYWGIGAEVEAVAVRASALKAAAASARVPDDAFAYPAERRLPLTTPLEVKAAAEAVLADRDAVPFTGRQKAAEAVLEKADAFGVGLGALNDELEKQAGRGVCSPDRVVRMIRNRSYAVKHAGVREELKVLADAVETARQKFCHPDNLVKLAAVLDGVDRANGLAGKYSELIPRPEDVLFEVPFTKAAGLLADKVELVTGSAYTKEALARLDVKSVRELFGDEFADSVKRGFDLDVEKFAEVAPTLPRPDAELLEALLQETGVHPVPVKSASQVRLGFSDEDLKAWADAYRA